MQIGVGSQVFRLREELKEAGVGHLQEVIADVPGVHTVADELRFCYIPNVAVAELRGETDGEELPGQVVLKGFEGKEFSGLANRRYNLKNVKIITNGRIVIERLPETQLVPA